MKNLKLNMKNRWFPMTFAAVLAVTVCETATAQNLNSAYFMDGYAYGHTLNPAKDYDRDSYLGLPGLSNFNIDFRGNTSLTSFFPEKVNGKGLTNYINPDPAYDNVLSGLKDNNKLVTNLRLDVISFGFHVHESYQTFGIALRANVGLDAPKSFFDMTKELSNDAAKKDYNVSDAYASATSWLELGYGYSRNVGKLMRLGAKAKLLLGLAYTRVDLNNLTLQDYNESTKSWDKVSSDATIEAGISNFSWGEPKKAKTVLPNGQQIEKELPLIEPRNMDISKVGLNGWGLAFDLGAEADFDRADMVEGLKASVALLDVGFIRWKNVAVAESNGGTYIVSKDSVKSKNGSDYSSVTDEMAELYQFHDANGHGKAKALAATLNIGVEYTLPCYRKLAFGFLSSTRMQGRYSWNEERFSVNWHPARWFEGGVNLGVGTFGATLGWIVNIHPRGFNIFLGGDSSLGKHNSVWMPTRSNANLNIGISFPMGYSTVKREKKA